MLAEITEWLDTKVEIFLGLGTLGVVLSLPWAFKKLLKIRTIGNSALGIKWKKKGIERDKQFRIQAEVLLAKIRDVATLRRDQGDLDQKEFAALFIQLDNLKDEIKHTPRGESWEFSWSTERELGRLDDLALDDLENAITSLSGEPDSMFNLCSKSITQANEALNKRGLLVIQSGE